MYIFHFKSLAVEAGFYGDAGEVVGFITKLSRLVPGWVLRGRLGKRYRRQARRDKKW